MGQYLTIFINDEAIFDYDGTSSIDDERQLFLDKMDADMRRGIKIQGQAIDSPNSDQRARFVVLNLIRALQQENNAIISASCAYLSHNKPELIEIRASNSQGPIEIEFIEASA
ncbi:MAG: hypothetical protein OEY11_04615 [Gammaproteobacteria bacterium]|nr:hypothetical protein [Gammaproteobacteria bacterium]